MSYCGYILNLIVKADFKVLGDGLHMIPKSVPYWSLTLKKLRSLRMVLRNHEFSVLRNYYRTAKLEVSLPLFIIIVGNLYLFQMKLLALFNIIVGNPTRTNTTQF